MDKLDYKFPTVESVHQAIAEAGLPSMLVSESDLFYIEMEGCEDGDNIVRLLNEYSQDSSNQQNDWDI